MYEELVRVPLVISWPGRIRPARSDALVSLIDLLPTLCDLTGVPAPDGRRRPVALFARSSSSALTTVREMVFGGVLREAGLARPDPDGTDRALEVRAIPELRRRAVRPRRGSRRAAQPGARARAPQRERARLARELDDWIRRTGDPFPTLTTTDRSGNVVTATRSRCQNRADVRLKPDATSSVFETGSTDQMQVKTPR